MEDDLPINHEFRQLLEDDEQFRAKVRLGIDQIERGEFIEEEEMKARFKRMLHA